MLAYLGDIYMTNTFFPWLLQYLGDIEEHLGVTIDQIATDLKIAQNEFDGKVVYGSKRVNRGNFLIKYVSIDLCFG